MTAIASTPPGVAPLATPAPAPTAEAEQRFAAESAGAEPGPQNVDRKGGKGHS